MSNKTAHPIMAGQCFRDRAGHRWSVKGTRPGPEGQFVIEAELNGAYPRVAVYTMTEREFRDHARSAALRPERIRHTERR